MRIAPGTGEGGLAKPPTTLVFPTVADRPLIPTFAGDFEFVSAVPEPGAWTFAGATAVLLLRRRAR